MAQYGHSQCSGPMIPDPDVGGARSVLGSGVVGQRQEALLKPPQHYRAGDQGTPSHTCHVILCDHAEYLAGPGV